jgi:hypothetical protein
VGNKEDDTRVSPGLDREREEEGFEAARYLSRSLGQDSQKLAYVLHHAHLHLEYNTPKMSLENCN